MHDSLGLLDGYKNLNAIATKENDLSTALRYTKLSEPISNILDARFKEDNLKLLRTKEELEYTSLEEELAAKEKMLTQRRIIHIMLALLAALVLIILLIRNVRKKRRITNKRLRAVNEDKNKLFSIIGHDLKSPINTLQELLDLYNKNEFENSELVPLISKLKHSVDQSAYTLNNLLFWARSQMNGISAEKQSVNVKAKAHETCQLYRSHIQKKQVAICCEIPEDLKVLADPDHLTIILRNIISNAIKFTPEDGRILFTAQENGTMTHITIHDKGVGMNKELIELITASDTVEPNPGTQGEKGVGLGLQIAKMLIGINQGTLSIESEVGQGSHFQMAFPKS